MFTIRESLKNENAALVADVDSRQYEFVVEENRKNYLAADGDGLDDTTDKDVVAADDVDGDTRPLVTSGKSLDRSAHTFLYHAPQPLSEPAK